MIRRDGATVAEVARDWAVRLEASPGVMLGDLEVLVLEDTGCNREAAHNAVMAATVRGPRGQWRAAQLAEIKEART